jgi:hypothetical protein
VGASVSAGLLVPAMAVTRQKTLRWIWLTAGPTAWMISSEANYALAGWQCDHDVNLTLPAAVVLGLIALGGALLAARAMRSETGTGRLLASVGLQIGLLSAAIVFTQGAASAVISACAR